MTKPKRHRDLTVNEAAESFHVAQATILNWLREGLLETNGEHLITAQSMAVFRSKYAGKNKLQARANKSLKNDHNVKEVGLAVQKELLADTFDDALGDHYEAMLSESYRNKEGIFYTPKDIVDDMMESIEVNDKTLFLDPCCGSGNFLLKALEMGVSPKHIYGYDTDPNAVKIARRRLKEKTGVEAVHVVCGDFLQKCHRLNKRFDVVFTNPPWGKKLPRNERMKHVREFEAGLSVDTSSLFVFAILKVLKPQGIAGLLLPDSFFRIASFEDVRKVVLQNTVLQMKAYGKPFKTMNAACSLLFRNEVAVEGHLVSCHDRGRAYDRPQQSFLEMPRHILNYWTSDREMAAIRQLMRHPYITLKGYATWGLGIVTGNNAKMCKRSRHGGLVALYRGKDILPGKLKAASLYIDPKDFPRYQQVSSMALLKAPEKLIYRFISSDVVFYCDTHQRYILNSANMLVLDERFPLSAKELAEIMNSQLTNWLFKQLFNTHRILRGDLELLPIFTDLSLHRRFNLLDLGR